MDFIILAGVKPYDGRYEFDLSAAGFTTREWGYLKRLSGYLPLTITEGLEGGDAELFAAFAVIALRRAGKIEQSEVQRVFDRIADADFGTSITLETDRSTVEEEADAGPPPKSSDGNTASSGTDSTTSTETSLPTRPPGGVLPSDFSESVLTRSGS